MLTNVSDLLNAYKLITSPKAKEMMENANITQDAAGFENGITKTSITKTSAATRIVYLRSKSQVLFPTLALHREEDSINSIL